MELTLEKIRAGILPVPADNVLDQIIDYARHRGIDVQWRKQDGYPVVVMRYTPNLNRDDVQLEEARYSQRSDPSGGPIPIGPGGRSDLPRLPLAQFPSVHLPQAELQVVDPPFETQPEADRYRQTSPTS